MLDGKNNNWVGGKRPCSLAFQWEQVIINQSLSANDSTGYFQKIGW
jgi:hypothetical protein